MISRVHFEPEGGWRNMFAWRPRKVYMGDARHYVWVWLHPIEYKSRDNDEAWPWMFRLRHEDVCDNS